MDPSGLYTDCLGDVMDEERKRIFLELHSTNHHEGPGNFAATQRAFSLLKDLPEKPQILDIGCGPGRQTMDLSRLTEEGLIIALDAHPPYVDRLEREVINQDETERIFPVVGNMSNLPFEKQSMDLIWSEGAVYNIGFEVGLREWKSLLRRKGYIVISELCWLKSNPPAELKEFWKEEYPNMQFSDYNLRVLQDIGYKYIDHFVIPESAWWAYYKPLQKRIRQLRKKYQDNRDAKFILDLEQKEINLYRKYSEFYGYVFYIGQVL